MNPKVALFCCNASQYIGAGHVMRSLSLAQRLHINAVDCVFLSNRDGLDIVQHHAPNYFQMIESDLSDERDREIIRIANVVNAFYVVWDSYEISESSITNVANHFPLMVIDDMYLLQNYTCDAILNQNIYANADKYHTNSETTVLAGSQYALLRDHFLAKTTNRMEHAILNILLTFGGSDPDNLSCLILGWLDQLKTPVHISIVVGKHFPFEDELNITIAGMPRRMDIICYREVVQIAELFRKQDLVVCAGGSTLNELACLGVPSCSIVTADNQMELAAEADRLGFCKSLGHKENLVRNNVVNTIEDLLINEARRQEMSRIGQQKIDGKGASRVADYILNKLT